MKSAPENDWNFIIRDHSNCFVGTKDMCMNPASNSLFGDMIGDDCGKDGVIDCCTNNTNAISQGARSCTSCPSCQEDPNYYREVACYEGCWNTSGVYRGTFNSIMRSHTDTPTTLGKVNEMILCQRIKMLTGGSAGICKNF